ncbi:hypothetical protein MTP99_011475 [Tenebrio molitor]|jgi:hypothetical protein|nr:hypothetical protein MTP99_011475 [Tenebrio molitor]
MKVSSLRRRLRTHLTWKRNDHIKQSALRVLFHRPMAIVGRPKRASGSAFCLCFTGVASNDEKDDALSPPSDTLMQPKRLIGGFGRPQNI